MRTAKFEHYKMHIIKAPHGGLCEVPTSALTRITSSAELGTPGEDGVDDGTLNVAIGFNFNFDSTTYNRIFINTNGALVPTNSTPAQDDGSGLDLWAISTEAKGYPIIAPFWSDMMTPPFTGSDYNDGHGIYYGTGSLRTGKKVFVCRWVGHKTSYTAHRGHITFEAVLHEDSNIIEFNYGKYVDQYPNINNINKPGFLYVAASGANTNYTNPYPAGGEWARCRYYLSQSHMLNNTYNLDKGLFGINPLGGSHSMFGFDKAAPHFGFWDNISNHHSEFYSLWPGAIDGQDRPPLKVIISPPKRQSRDEYSPDISYSGRITG